MEVIDMPESEINKIIAKNINKYLNSRNKTQVDLADYMGVSQATVSNWCKGIKTPRMDKIDKICDFFNCKRSDLMEDKTEVDDSYYLNEETKKIAQEIYENKELGLLFDAARTAEPEDLKTVHTMLTALKRKEKGDEY